MKKKCIYCGKRFNLEEYNGICPYCVKYNNTGNSDYHSEQDIQAAHVKPNTQKHVKAAKPNEDITIKHKLLSFLVQTRQQAVICIALVIAIIAVPIIVYRNNYLTEKRLYKEWTINELSIEEISVNQRFSFLQDELTILQPDIFIHNGIETSDGFTYISVPFKAAHGGVYGWDCEVYLRADDIYLSPQSIYSMTNDETVLHLLRAENIYTVPSDYSGQLIFYVPDLASELELIIYEKTVPDDSTEKITRTFNIPVYIER